MLCITVCVVLVVPRVSQESQARVTIATNASVLADTQDLVDGQRLLCYDQSALWLYRSV